MTRWYPWGAAIEEPVLTDEDKRLWAKWQRAYSVHARTQRYARMEARALDTIADMAKICPRASVAFSCGKDSTVLMVLAGIVGITRAHIICSDVNMHLRWEEYCKYVSDRTGIAVNQWWPDDFSAQQYIESGYVDAADSICMNTDPLARMGFFDVARKKTIEDGKPGLLMGLRAEESRGRRLNRKHRGVMYQHSDYGTVCNPLSDWSWLDVYACLAKNEVAPFHPYWCLRVKNNPKRSRLDGWLPGSWAADGAGIELRVFYPSLFQRWKGLFGEDVTHHT